MKTKANKGRLWKFTGVLALLGFAASLIGCADDPYGYRGYRTGYYASAYPGYNNGPYYGPYANRPIGYGPPTYAVYPYNTPYGYAPYGYGNGVSVSVGGGRGYYGSGYYPGGYYDRSSKKKRKKLRKQVKRETIAQPGYYQE